MNALSLARTTPSTIAPGPNTRRLGLLVVVALLVVLFSIRHSSFLTLDNAQTTLLNITSIAIAAMGSAMLLISGHIDLSIGGMYALISMVVAFVAVHAGMTAAVLAGLLVGACLGFTNGALVRLLKISPLIVTIGLMSVYGGAAYVVSSQSIFGFSDGFLAIGRGSLASVPIPTIVAVVTVILVGFYLTRTVGGMRLYAVGGDKLAAQRSGVRVGRTVLAVYTANGLLIGLASILTTAQLGSSSPALGANFSFDVLTAVILGGVAFDGGSGRPIGIVIGVLTIGVLNAGLVFEGLQYWWQEVAKGSILLLALAADQASTAHRARKSARGPVPSSSSVAGGQNTKTTAAASAPLTPDSQAPGEVAFEVKDVCKSYGAMQALEPLSMSLRKGEVVALLGDNGAGKSTLTKIISGAVQPSGGSLVLDGKPVEFTEPADARRVGIETVYQDLALCPNLNIVHNMALGKEATRRWLGVRIRDDRQATNETAAKLSKLATRSFSPLTQVDALSGGQRQAVAIARAIGDNVRLVCFDEPTAALGVTQTENVLRLAQATARQGAAVLMVTHDVASVKKICHRVVVLARGQKVHDGPVDALTEHELIDLMSGRPRAHN
ncbi:ATP-binding cassette domain-containing protein [Rhodococcus sp. NPDC057297]|uniref:ABC transporter permease subunit n=1 Tax=Rhodococcus sp. NPDC057297 TaxID=3346090 RepID=UPI00362918E6